MKYKIEKNTVQETLIIPLFARKVCSELYPNIYRDETAVRLIDEIDYANGERISSSVLETDGSKPNSNELLRSVYRTPAGNY